MKTLDPAANDKHIDDSPNRAFSDVPLDNVRKGRWERSWPTMLAAQDCSLTAILMGKVHASKHNVP